MNKLRNIEHEEVIQLSALVGYTEGEVASKTLVQNEAVGVTLFAFSKGEEISTHVSSGDALVSVIEGEAKITVDGVVYLLNEGESIVMSANKPHAVYAVSNFKMMLTVVF